jgi:uncharacterized paraquat-inducible protein A
MKINNPAAAGIKKNNKKKKLIECSSVILSIISPAVPANLFPMPIARYQIPKTNAIIVPGINLLR